MVLLNQILRILFALEKIEINQPALPLTTMPYSGPAFK